MIRDIACHITAAVVAGDRAARYGLALGIRRKELWRYLKKSMSLALCYSGFGIRRTVGEARRAGEAGFLCCAYDVITDWRNFDKKGLVAFESILKERVLQCDVKELAMYLYETERIHKLREDGLTRGAVALRCVLRIMECETEWERLWPDLDEVGKLCQIVDDVLDYEDDCARGEINCLKSSRIREHLTVLITTFDPSQTRTLFGGRSSVLTVVIERARVKAIGMLASLERNGGNDRGPATYSCDYEETPQAFV